MCYNLFMTKSGLPIAKQINKSVKIGSVTLKTEVPSESYSDAKKVISSLEKAGRDNVFNQNEGLQC